MFLMILVAFSSRVSLTLVMTNNVVYEIKRIVLADLTFLKLYDSINSNVEDFVGRNYRVEPHVECLQQKRGDCEYKL